MTTNDVICRVCALYPYVSTDASSLSFDKGAVIDVLAQLDSGWWDGWCNGKRGWFPSNYVQVIEDDVDVPPIPRNDSSVSPPKRDSTWTDTQTFSRQYRNSTIDVHSHGDIEPHPNNETDRSNWILQTTEDGSEVYYYNVVTKEMRYSAPHEEFQRHDPLPTANSFGQKKYAYDEYDGVRPSKPTRAVNRIDNARAMDDVSYISGGTVASGSTCTPSILTSRSGIDDQLLPNWVRKFTPKGREYFCNIATDETVWSLDQVDPVTGVVYSRSPFPVSTEHKVPEEARLSLATMGGRGIDEAPRNWNQLSSLVAHAVRNLKDSVQQGHINVFRKEALVVVQQIRLLLYVSNAVDKENSPNLKASKQLRTHHRALLAALAKLVLSAKVASGAWPPPEAINKLQLDADEVLVAVRSFLSVAQEMQLEILDSAPKLLQSGNAPPRWRNTASIGAKPDAITTLLVLADNVHGAIASLMDSIRDVVSATDESTILSKVKSDIPLLVAQFRNLSNTTSQFLNSVDDFSTLKSSHAVRLSAAKQEICNAMGALFIETQKISSPNAIPKVIFTAFDDIESCAKIVESNAQEICLLSRQLAVQASPAQIPEGGAGRRPSQDAIRPALPNRASRSLETVEERLMDRNPIDSSGPVDQGAPKMENVSTHQPGDKLAKFFGEDILAAARRRDTVLGAPAPAQGVAFASGTPGSSPSVNERTDFLGSDYNPNEIVFNMEGDVKGGTLTALVQRLTQHDQLDSKFITTFLLTYRSFCTTREMFDALFKRYSLAPPPDLTPEELQIWHEKKLKLVRLRVFNVIKQWLETYYNDEEDRAILPDLMTFADTTVRESMQFGAEQLIKIIRKRMDAEESSQIKKMTLNVRTSDMPAPLLPKNLKRIRFLDIDPLELARQLTIMDSKLYSRIKPVECLDKNWGKGDSELIAANVKASIEYSNQVTAWVTDSILSKDEVKKRAAVVKHWIYVAEKCRQLNNYNTCMAILSAFDNSSIGRLKRTWELMGARTMQILTGIRRLMGANKNFTEYRDIIHKVNPPCIPFLGIYLQDLTFIEDGNSNFLKKSNHLINFAKRMKTAEVIRELQQYQSTPYLLQAVPDIQEFIKTHLQSSRDEETLYNLSLALEPRERDEDTIARRLKESGL